MQMLKRRKTASSPSKIASPITQRFRIFFSISVCTIVPSFFPCISFSFFCFSLYSSTSPQIFQQCLLYKPFHDHSQATSASLASTHAQLASCPLLQRIKIGKSFCLSIQHPPNIRRDSSQLHRCLIQVLGSTRTHAPPALPGTCPAVRPFSL